MARDSTVGQQRVVVMPGGGGVGVGGGGGNGGLNVDGVPVPTQPPDDISQEILEVIVLQKTTL